MGVAPLACGVDALAVAPCHCSGTECVIGPGCAIVLTPPWGWLTDIVIDDMVDPDPATLCPAGIIPPG